MVLALEVPTIKLKRQHITFAFLDNEATSQLVLIAQFAVEWFPNPDPMDQQTKVFNTF